MNPRPKSRCRSPEELALNMAVARRLKDARLSMVPKMTQVRLGAALGVSFQMIQKFENGDCRMSPAQLVMVAKALRLPVDFLLLGFEVDFGEKGVDRGGGVF